MKTQIGATLFAFMALALVELACNSSVPTQQAPTPLPPTQSAAVIELRPSPSQEQSNPAPLAVQGPITEQFDGDLSNWSYFSGSNDSETDDSQARPITEDGFLVFEIGKHLDVYAVYEPGTYENVEVDASVDNRGSNNHTVNLVCRLSEQGWYEVSIDNNGLFWLFACDVRRNACVKLADGGSNQIHSGRGTNEYSFKCQGRLLKLAVNGVNTMAYTDNRFLYESGKIGVGISSFSDSHNKIEFDWVKIIPQ